MDYEHRMCPFTELQGALTCTTYLLHLLPFPLTLHPLSGGTSSCLNLLSKQVSVSISPYLGCTSSR